jgi:hypothetical protein
MMTFRPWSSALLTPEWMPRKKVNEFAPSHDCFSCQLAPSKSQAPTPGSMNEIERVRAADNDCDKND